MTLITTTEIYFRNVQPEDPPNITNVTRESIRHREVKQLGKEVAGEEIQF